MPLAQKIKKMEKNLVLSLGEGTPCVCVLFSGSETPGYLDYQNKNILTTLPAWQKDGKYYAVETGKEIHASSQMTVWSLQSGVGFTLTSGTKIFLTRQLFGAKEYFWLKSAEAERFELGNKAAFGTVTKFAEVREVQKKYRRIFGLTA